jgi:hypothetical protein
MCLQITITIRNEATDSIMRMLCSAMFGHIAHYTCKMVLLEHTLEILVV